MSGIKYDFHLHSALSPCGDMDMTPNNIVNMAKLIGLDAIAVTDHNSIGNARSAMKVGESVGLKVVPGMEVETNEEVHILTLYPDIRAAEYVAEIVYSRLPDIPNKPEIFGAQAFMDEEDNVIGYEDKTLISSADISINELFGYVEEAGGIFIPAHVDRHSYSVLTNLGFVPDDIDIKYIEVSRRTTDVAAYLESRKDLKRYGILRNSDAHYLEDIGEPDEELPDDIYKILFKDV